MSVIIVLITASFLLALSFLGAFVWAMKSGQFDDSTTPAMRILMDEKEKTQIK